MMISTIFTRLKHIESNVKQNKNCRWKTKRNGLTRINKKIPSICITFDFMEKEFLHVLFLCVRDTFRAEYIYQ